jgi:hypothetical protein
VAGIEAISAITRIITKPTTNTRVAMTAGSALWRSNSQSR